jgi:selenocysteine lyase/cysteine desulfurase
MNKREFLKNMSGLASATLLPRELVHLLDDYSNHTPQELSKDEDFWLKIRQGYRLKPDYINLENGYYCFIPQETLEHFLDHVREVNYQGSYYMRTVQWKNKQDIAGKLADLLGASKDEVVITRNTTESLDTIISGIDWKEGDEAVFAEQDYGAMQDQFKLMAQRYGIVNRIVSVPNHPASDQEIVDLYASAITPRTRLLMVCHMINITGHILPIRKICDMAHDLGVDVMVDGAHAFGHIEFNISDLDCDYYGTSLHKWLSVPLGSGLLYVKKGKAANIWPLFAEHNRDREDVWNLNHTGTHPVHTDLAIANAIDFYMRLGPARKEARLRYLQNYWTSRAREIEGVVVNTPVDAWRSCGIGNVGIHGMNPSEMAKRLFEEYKIWTVAIDGAGVHGCRITPNIYSTVAELDRFLYALGELSV